MSESLLAVVGLDDRAPYSAHLVRSNAYPNEIRRGRGGIDLFGHRYSQGPREICSRPSIRLRASGVVA